METNESALRDALPFRLLDLPPELRLEIYRYLLPNDATITYVLKAGQMPRGWKTKRKGLSPNSVGRSILCPVLLSVDPKGSAPMPVNGTTESLKPAYAHKPRQSPKPNGVCSTLFLINKLVANEAAGMLYDSNNYRFLIGFVHDDLRLQPEKPEVFWNMSEQFGRSVKNVQIEVSSVCWPTKLLFVAATQFFKTFAAAVPSISDESHLENVVVKYVRKKQLRMSKHPWINRANVPKKYWPTALEPLAELPQVKNLTFSGFPHRGNLHDFGVMLENYVKTEPENRLALRELTYTRKEIDTTRGLKTWKSSRTDKFYYHPTYDWTAVKVEEVDDEDEVGE